MALYISHLLVTLHTRGMSGEKSVKRQDLLYLLPRMKKKQICTRTLSWRVKWKITWFFRCCRKGCQLGDWHPSWPRVLSPLCITGTHIHFCTDEIQQALEEYGWARRCRQEVLAIMHQPPVTSYPACLARTTFWKPYKYSLAHIFLWCRGSSRGTEYRRT